MIGDKIKSVSNEEEGLTIRFENGDNVFVGHVVLDSIRNIAKIENNKVLDKKYYCTDSVSELIFELEEKIFPICMTCSQKMIGTCDFCGRISE